MDIMKKLAVGCISIPLIFTNIHIEQPTQQFTNSLQTNHVIGQTNQPDSIPKEDASEGAMEDAKNVPSPEEQASKQIPEITQFDLSDDTLTSITLAFPKEEGANYTLYGSTKPEDFSQPKLQPELQLYEGSEPTYTHEKFQSELTYYYSLAINGVRVGETLTFSPTLTKIQDLKTTSIEPKQISLAWTEITDATSYDIYRSTIQAGTYTKIGTTTSPTFVDTSVALATNYYYRIIVFTKNNSISLPCPFLSVQTPCEAPVIENNEFNRKTKSVILSWKPVTGANSYSVYRAESETGTYDAIATTKATSYIDTNLTLGKPMHYKITATSNTIESPFSTSITVTPEYQKPLDLTVALNNLTTARLTWSENFPVEQYNIYRCEGNSEQFKLLSTTTTANYEDTTIQPGIVYYYCVTASDQTAYESERSDIATTQSKLNAPEYVQVSFLTPTSVKVSWKPVSEATDYNIYRSTTKTGHYERIATSANHTITDSNLSLDQTYYYRITAKLNSFESPRSNLAYATRQLEAPTQLKITSVKNNQIAFSWNAVKNIQSYCIYRSTSPKSGFSKLNSSNTNSYVDTTASMGVVYYYYVTSYDGYESDRSNIVSVRSSLPIPKNLNVSLTSTNSYQLTWDRVSSATEYNVYRSDTTDLNFKKIATTKVTYYKDSNISVRNKYFYRITAIKDGVESEYSNTYEVNGYNSKPFGLSATNSQGAKIYLSWIKSEGNVKYNVYRSFYSSYGYYKITTTQNTYYEDRNVTPGTTYYYYITPTDGYWQEGASSDVVSATAEITPPYYVYATQHNANRITVNWSAVAGAKYYGVYRYDNSTYNYKKINVIATNSYTDYNIVKGRTYSYRITAIRDRYETTPTYSDSIYVPTTTYQEENNYFYTKPKNLKGTLTYGNKVKLEWDAVRGASNYSIYRSTNKAYGFVTIATSSTNTYTDSNITNGTSYYYYVCPSNGYYINGTYSDTICVDTNLNAPKNLKSKAPNYHSISLTWNTSPGATTYTIYRSENSSKHYKQIGTSSTPAYTDTKVATGKRFYYRVTACTNYSESTQSTFTSCIAKVSIPKKLRASRNSYNSVKLKWKPVSEADKYEIYQSSDAFHFKKIATTTSTNYIARKLKTKKMYYFKIKASKDGIRSRYSNCTTAIPRLLSPKKPKIKASKGKITLSWRKVSDAKTYYVYRSTKKRGGYKLIKKTKSTRYYDRKLSSKRTYYYKIKAVRGKVKSSYSKIVKAKFRR